MSHHDQPTTAIAEFTVLAKSSDLNDKIVRAAVEHNIDAIGCALGAVNIDASQIALKIAASAPSDEGVSVIGLSKKVAPEQAVFANTTMIRQLDYNDANLGGGHPSDFIPSIFAAAELTGGTGEDFVRGIYVGYAVFAALFDRYDTIDAGWDGGQYMAIASAMAAGTVFGMDFEQLANAVAIALVPAVSLLNTRHGEVSNWKGSASAHSAMLGLFAARLAREGLTGPAEPFEGEDGLHRQSPPKAEMAVGELKDGLTAIERCMFKYHPAQISTQGLIEPLAAVRHQFKPEDVVKISIQCYRRAWIAVGGGGNDKAEKWNPQSRETADHSLPYIAAIALLDGGLTHDSYSDERLKDPAVHALMKVTTVDPNDEWSALYPKESKLEAKIELKNGEVIIVPSGYPVGDVRNPMTEEQIKKKFHHLAKASITEPAAADMEKVLWDVPNLKDMEELAKLYRAV